MKIVLATGGSAGHLFPAIEVAKCLRSDGHEVIFLGTFGAGKNRISDEGFTWEELQAKGLQGKGMLDDFLAVLKIIQATTQAFSKLKKIKPQVVAGFGGYGAFPVVCAAVILRLPTLIHEQNVVPGRANKLLGRFVKKVAVSFNQSKTYFKSRKLVHTGCPVLFSSGQYDRLQLSREIGIKTTQKILLVFGGSQGSQRINQTFCEALGLAGSKLAIQVIHISGKGKLDELKKMYRNLKHPSVVFEFFEPMQKLYQLADVVISRAGASTVNELVLFRKPAVLIPYPYAKGHQKENAAVLVDAGTAKMVSEEELSAEKLTEVISGLLDHPPASEKFDHLIKDLNIRESAKSLAEAITSTI